MGKPVFTLGAWQEARALVYAHRGRLALGLVLLLVNRLAGLVLPSSSKWVIDRVINQHHPELLLRPPPPPAPRRWSRRRPASACRRSSVSPPSGRSPTCAAPSRPTSCAFPSATSTPPR